MRFRDIDLKELFELMQEYDISETKLTDGKAEVKVKRGKEPVVVSAGAFTGPMAAGFSAPPAEPVNQRPETSASEPAKETAPPEAEKAPAAEDNFHKITAPLVGTFYRASAPDADAYVDVGSRVKVGDVVCIVEAMKSMNEIKSDTNGVVKEICLENAQMVEFEQVMFKVDTAG